MKYLVEEAIDAGIIALAPVLFWMRRVMKFEVLDAEDETTVHPPFAAVEVAKSANTESVETTPVTAQSAASVVVAAIVKVFLMREHVPLYIPLIFVVSPDVLVPIVIDLT